MTIHAQPSQLVQAARPPGIFDMDIHPAYNSLGDLYQYMPDRWVDFHRSYGTIPHQYFKGHPIFPRIYMRGSRRDAVPSKDEAAGSNLAFMQDQHLDHHNIRHGVLFPLPIEQGMRNAGFAAAVCRAVNLWQCEEWLNRDSRLRGTILVPVEDPQACIDEIRFWADDKRFIQVGFPSRCGRLLGSKHFWPVFKVATTAGRSVAIHPNWGDSDLPITSSGWPSFYFEEAAAYAGAMQAHLASLILSGQFDDLPDLRVVMIEGGFSWVPSFCWRLDKLWPKFKGETPIRDTPSSYVRKHLWFTSQPIDEPDSPHQLKDIFDWIGWDRMLFSTDYPHWDNDDPAYVLPFETTPEQRTAFLAGNALKLFGLE